MDSKKWKNPYIDLVHSLPGHLIACPEDVLSAAERALLFGRMAQYQSIFFDVGCGSGNFILELAKMNPQALYVGIELRFKRAFRAAEKAFEREMNNLLVVRTAAWQVWDILAENTLDGIYVNFPDPWSKRRWLKHRLLDKKFLERAAGLLKADGFFSYKTDHPEYFDETVTILSDIREFRIETRGLDLHSSNFNGANILTEFEKLFRSKGTPAHYLLAIKVGSGPQLGL